MTDTNLVGAGGPPPAHPDIDPPHRTFLVLELPERHLLLIDRYSDGTTTVAEKHAGDRTWGPPISVTVVEEGRDG